GRLTQLFRKAHYQVTAIRWKHTAALGLLGSLMLLVLFFGVTAAYAQNSNATIRGQVLDPSGALVPNADVVIVNKQTGVTVFTGHTDSSGSFVASQVIPGTYQVTVSASSLKRKILNNVLATVAQVESLNVQMELGQVSEVVTVESKGETIERS